MRNAGCCCVVYVGPWASTRPLRRTWGCSRRRRRKKVVNQRKSSHGLGDKKIWKKAEKIFKTRLLFSILKGYQKEIGHKGTWKKVKQQCNLDKKKSWNGFLPSLPISSLNIFSWSWILTFFICDSYIFWLVYWHKKLTVKQFASDFNQKEGHNIGVIAVAELCNYQSLLTTATMSDFDGSGHYIQSNNTMGGGEASRREEEGCVYITV